MVESGQWVQGGALNYPDSFLSAYNFLLKYVERTQKCTKNKMFLELILAGSNKHITISNFSIANN